MSLLFVAALSCTTTICMVQRWQLRQRPEPEVADDVHARPSGDPDIIDAVAYMAKRRLIEMSTPDDVA